jgi:hypothetical protein
MGALWLKRDRVGDDESCRAKQRLGWSLQARPGRSG